jgi:uncharacterized protein
MATEANPGVYVREETAFPTKIIGVATTVPYFIGYTETAKKRFTPVAINSVKDFEAAFGGRCAAADALPDGTCPWGKGVALPYLLYDSLRLFYDNGGGTCHVISAGSFADAVTLGALREALDAAGQAGATLLAAPDAVRLTANDFSTFAQAMLMQAGTLQDRMALLDVPVGEARTKDEGTFGKHHMDGIAWFREAVSTEHLSYGAAYFPFLWVQLADGTGVQVPPSGAMAGIIVYSDTMNGLWQAPANIGVHSVVAPSVRMTDADQAVLVLDGGAGKSIDAIRLFPGLGTMVWGGRTLDGNNPDYRYIQIRRTIIYIEQSVKTALGQFVFAPNDAATWIAVTGMVSAFLAELWQAGGLVGASARNAFSVACGLGSTMTDTDILNGILRMEIQVAIAHPAEFIAITIEQQQMASR